MKPFIPITMNFLTSLLTALFCLTQAGCAPGNIGEPPNPKITFELPAEWEDYSQSGGGRLWTALVYDSEKEAISKFMMVQLNGAKDQTYPGATSKEKAEKYHEQESIDCSPEFDDCTVEPIRVVEHAGIAGYAFSTDHDRVSGSWWHTNFFFEKDGVMFEFTIVGRFEAELTQKTYQKVFETLKVSYSP